MSCQADWLEYGAGMAGIVGGGLTAEVGVGFFAMAAGLMASEAAVDRLKEDGCL